MVQQQSASDVAPAAAAPSGAAQSAGGPRRFLTSGMAIRVAVMLVAGAIVVLFVTRWDVWVGAWARQTTDDAYVRGDITPLSAKVEGYVHRVPVADFQLAKAGDHFKVDSFK